MSKVRTIFSYAALVLFAAASTPTMATSVEEGLCRDYIERCDADNDGLVSVEEWEACSDANGAVIFQEIDLDGNGFLTCPEVIFFFLG